MIGFVLDTHGAEKYVWPETTVGELLGQNVHNLLKTKHIVTRNKHKVKRTCTPYWPTTWAKCSDTQCGKEPVRSCTKHYQYLFIFLLLHSPGIAAHGRKKQAQASLATLRGAAALHARIEPGQDGSRYNYPLSGAKIGVVGLLMQTRSPPSQQALRPIYHQYIYIYIFFFFCFESVSATRDGGGPPSLLLTKATSNEQHTTPCTGLLLLLFIYVERPMRCQLQHVILLALHMAMGLAVLPMCL